METGKRVHFMGIGGAGVSAVAAFAKAAGFKISGCDLDLESQFLKQLSYDNVEIFSNHDEKHLESADILVVSPAIESLDSNNKELLAAKEKNLPVLLGEEFLSQYMIADKKIIAITGTHGKSTTTAMVGKILEDSGFDPSVFVGAVVLDWRKNYRIGHGDYFVLEADEYQEKFLLYHPFVSVVTAIEMDHPEYFSNEEAVKSAFQKFISQTDEEGTIVLGENVDLEVGKIRKKTVEKQKINLKLIGELNQTNASVAATVASVLGVEDAKIKESLSRFGGISRRFELKGEEKGVKVFDDYGHHPTAIKATIEAAEKEFQGKRIWLVYQPHMFSRTKYLFDDFVKVFSSLNIHEIILVDIFAARQENKENISSRDIVDAVKRESVKYIPRFEESAEYLNTSTQANDIVIVMGAGDIYKLSSIFLEKLKNRG